MIRTLTLSVLLGAALLLAACSGATPPESTPPESTPAPASTDTPSTAEPAAAEDGLTRSDVQGAVEFAVTPLNLDSAGDTLAFDVSMNTHSMDLSWDLAAQSTLTADTGLEVKGSSWPVGSGHHYEGELTFPAKTPEGRAILDGAKTLTLTIAGTDVPARVFVWELGQ